MNPRRSPRSPALFLALLPAFWGALSCGSSGPESNEADATSERSASEDPASNALANASFMVLQGQIEQREYRAGANSRGLQAPNRAHNLRTYFAPDGIRVHDRTQPGSPELLSLKLAAVGRGETPIPVDPGEVTADGARVEIVRPGFIEWYENSPAGLEQGFTLTQRPTGDGPLVVELSVSGANASMQREQVNFATSTGRQLSFAKLAAVDAHGQALASHFQLPELSRLQLVVDDGAAIYPIVIDPLLTATADTQLESNQVNGSLGTSVAGAGDVNGDGYDDVIVGASAYDAGESNEGAAFIFLGSADGIASGGPATADTQLESNQAGAYFGASVAGVGDVNDDGYADVIVGAYLYDAGEENEGAAFVFLGGAAGIPDGDPSTADAQLESDQEDANLGYSAAGAGDVDDDGYADVIVGAYRYDTGLGVLSCTDGAPNRRPYACCDGPAEGECFDEGAAFVFRGGAAGIASGTPASADTVLAGDQAAAWFGWSVAGAGSVNGNVDGGNYGDVVVGTPAWDLIRSRTQSVIFDWGAAYVFHGSATGIADANPATAATRLNAGSGNHDFSLFGSSVAGAGDVDNDGFSDIIVGAYHYQTNVPAGDVKNEGLALIYRGSAAGIPDGTIATASTRLESNQEDAWMGWSVAGAGDINDDGYSDVIVGSHLFDAGEMDEGAAFIFLGTDAGIPSGDPSSAAIQLESNQPNAWLGWSVAAAGDVNGDGADDVIVSAPYFDVEMSNEGATFVYLSDPVIVPTPEPTFIVGLAAGVACLAILARRR